MPGLILSLELARTLSPIAANWSDLIPADNNCTYGIHWMWVFMGQCVMDTRGLLAVICGIICLCISIIVGIPQIVENFRTGIPDQALSPFMLMFWTLGDATNFVGCVLTHQLVLQIFISVYSITNDLILISQFVYYKIRHKMVLTYVIEELGDGSVPPEHDTMSSEDTVAHSDSSPLLGPTSRRVLPVCFLGVFAMTILSSNPSSFPESSHRDDLTRPSSRHLLSLNPADSVTDIPFLPTVSSKIGYVLGCISSLMYLCSRIPQICRNWRRGSTEGVCLVLFCLAVLGNLFYGLQIFLTSTETMFLLRSFPWLLGSIGVINLDLTILFQFYYFSPPKSRQLPTPSDVQSV